MALPPQFLDEIRARLSLSSVIGRTVKLIKAGREYKACCPFHKEKTPSFTVNDDKGFYHCLAAETGVVVRDGVVPIASLAGTVTEVLTRGGRWVPATFKSYGVQRLHRIGLTRNGLKKEIFATSGHRWFVRGAQGAITTARLRPGHRLEAVLPAPREDWSLDPEGVRHGVVFGDGSADKGLYGHVHLHGAKDMVLAGWFPDQVPQAREREGGKGYLRIYGGRAFGHMKTLPDASRGEAYLLGFIAGYLAADGHVAKDGTVMLHSANREHLEWIRVTATRLGLGTYGITTAQRRGFGTEVSPLHRIHFVPSTLRPELFLLDDARARFASATKAFARLRWVVESVEESPREEEVFCAEVPEEHAFALEDNILTGNCFGCGAHGDVFTFEMENGGLSFREAVDKLAAQAGLEVPRETPQAREEARRRADLYEVIEAACRYFESQLRLPAGKEGMAYLRRRGLDDATIAHFRLGWAPAAPPGQLGPLRAALAREGIDDGQLVEAGLLKRRDDGTLYDYFRERVLFPITDKRGRVIAFGGRILTDAQPKYLNSPDTPLFHKGSVLYGLAQAREAAGRTGEVIVTEGYMDVIALARAGFPQAVAPLGTALTETQIEELWKLVDEPLLCFDGDAAGQRAAARAADRALPILRPGKSLRFALVPGGQDPDDLIRDSGPQAMRDVLEAARPLLDVLWTQALEGRSLETPERRAALEADLDAMVQRIADRAVQGHYRSAVRDRLWQLFRGQRGGGRPQGGGFVPAAKGKGGKGAKGGWQPALPQPPLPQPSERSAEILRHGILLATLISHPALVDAVGERLGLLEYPDARLDKLRGGVLMVLGRQPALDSEGLVDQLRSSGFGEELDSLLNSDVFAHARFARPDADLDTARRGWENAYDMNRRKDLKADGSRIVERIAADPTEEACEILRAFKQDRQTFDDD